MESSTLGQFLASRLLEVGVTHIFGVPGDFNLVLLDQFVEKDGLETVWCCNELNAGYAADGFARRKGVGACVVTYGVGGFSVINAIAGAYSEDLPVILISGGPNSNDYAANHTLHHTIGLHDFGQQMRAFREVTCAQVLVQHITEAHHQIDWAISQALQYRKPAYIEICCNLAGLSHPSFSVTPVAYSIPSRHTNKASLDAAVRAAAEVLNKAVKPVLLAGPRLRHDNRRGAFQTLAEACQYGAAVTPDGKGLFQEDHDNFIGMYWGATSSPCCCEIVEAADVVVVAGAVWTDYSTVGYSLLMKPEKCVTVETNSVTIMGGQTFGCVDMQDFLFALADALKPNDTSKANFKRMFVPRGVPESNNPDEPLATKIMFKHLQEFVTSDMAVLTETGDSWFNALRLRLPPGCGFEIQLRYGSIGWSVGATLGYALAAAADGKRLLSMIGDGSFQVTAQDVSSMLRFNANPIILLVNNKGYTIEVEIHDGPYNNVQNWDYVGVVKGFHNGCGKLFATRVQTERELVEALQTAKELDDHVVFIELIIDRHDCSSELLEFGARVAAANSRPPNPQ